MTTPFPPAMMGNGLSTSPSAMAPPFDRSRYPQWSILDNVRAQRRISIAGDPVHRGVDWTFIRDRVHAVLAE